MYVILVYDLTIDKINAVRITVKQYLNWVQNSVFEGEITNANLTELKSKIGNLIDNDVDSVLIYRIDNTKWMKKETLGIQKNDTGNII